MDDERLNTVRTAIEDLNSTMYQLSGVGEMLGDIIDEIPFREDKAGDPSECLAFCIWAQKKLRVLVNHLMVQSKKGGEMVSALEKEFFRQ